MKIFHFITLLAIIPFIFSCNNEASASLAQDESEIINQEASSKFYALNEDWKTFIYENENNLSELINIEHYQSSEINLFVLSFSNGKESYYSISNESEKGKISENLTRVQCVGSQASCQGLLDTEELRIRCSCESDECYMTITTSKDQKSRARKYSQKLSR